jgi:hypothetical protein
MEHDRTTGDLYIKHGNGTLLATGPTIVTSSNTTNYFELKVVIHDSAGSVELRQNEVVVASATSIDTKNGGTGAANQVKIRMGDNNTGGASFYIDDLYVDDSTYNGDIRAEVIIPNGNGNYSDFVGSDADQTDNYLLVDEIPHNSDTDYVESNTPDDVDTYTMGDLVTTAGNVIAVITHVVAKKDNAGSRSVIPVIRIGSTDYDGSSNSVSTDYINYSEVLLQSPATTNDWTISEINGMEYGEKVA